MELTEKQIVKALRCCTKANAEACRNCPIDYNIKENCECCTFLARQALKLVKGLKAQIKANDERRGKQ